MLSRFHGKATVITKKRRGPAPTGKGTLVGVRLQPSQLDALDGWIAKQGASMTRPEAIRVVLNLVLHVGSRFSKSDKRRPRAPVVDLK